MARSVQKIMKETHADVVAFDAAEEPVMLVEVKAMREVDPEVYAETIELLRARADEHAIPFFMLADLATVRIFQRGSALPDLEVPYESALAPYEVEPTAGPRGRIYHRYLERLVEAWLRDLAYHWKSESPPYQAELERLGLVEKIARGSTVSESSFAA
jgi:hypothetical protein